MEKVKRINVRNMLGSTGTRLYINQQDAQNYCDQTLFSIRCSTCFGLNQSIIRNNFISCTSHLVYAGTSGCCVPIATQQPHVSAYTGIYQLRCTAYKVAPEDGIIQSETCRAFNGKQSNHTNFVHLVGLYTYFRMMHGAYIIKSTHYFHPAAAAAE